MEILNIKDLSFTYPTTGKTALNRVSLSVNEGDFVLLCGASGSGKSTLLRLLKDEIAPFGKKEGEIHKAEGTSFAILTQDTENQIVSDTVWHNMAFSLEALNRPRTEIRQKIAEIAEFFGLTHLFHKKTNELSGGEKQLLNLASVMVTDPDVLLLDEPTSQLDPIAARSFTDIIKRLNREMNTTVIISEHRTEELFAFADKLCILDEGALVVCESPEKIGEKADTIADATLSMLPSPLRLYKALGSMGKCPLTVRECREYIENNFNTSVKRLSEDKEHSGKNAIELKDVYFRYAKNSADVLNALDLKANFSEILTVLGGNGSGKTSLLSLISSVNRPYAGKIKKAAKKIAVLPQNPKSVFIKDVLKDDLAAIDKNYLDTAKELGIENLLDRDPYDLSGGETQRAALAKILLLKPDLLCLDEPTKGLDANRKNELISILRSLSKRGVCIIITTHDADFAAEVSDRCAMLFDGEITSEGTPREFFSVNKFYTTYASLISRRVFENAVTMDDVISLCRKNGEKK